MEELNILHSLYKSSQELQMDFWKAPTGVGVFTDVMVGPDFLTAMLKFLNENGFDFKITIDDVQRLILQREKPKPSTVGNSTDPVLASFFIKRMKDESSRNQAKYGFGDYHSYDEMLRWMDDIERFYPRMAKVFTIGTTYEGRPIKGIKIGSPIEDTSKRAVWIDGGMHAREWAAIHTALYFIEQLISQYNVDPKLTEYVNTLSFYFVPVANPDGFEYSRSDVTPQTRFWRKNRGPQVCKKDRWRRERCCGGVDLNRNFDFHWGETGSSNDLCSDIFQGTSAFSEPESRAIRDKILSPELRGKVDAFITLHTYSQMWIHPYNHERKAFPADILDLQQVGKRGVRAIESMYGTKFRFGTGADILYPSSGGSDDWAKAKGGVKYVYLLELRPGEEEWDGFLLDRRQLIPTGRETWEGIKVVIDAVLANARRMVPAITTARPTIATTTPPLVTFTRAPDQAVALRSGLHDRLDRLRTTQMRARIDYERRLQVAEQQRQMQFWQTQHSEL
ncbi:Peptidase M14 [Aphelenchoides avenae]|nr:Peptidase M14 [Aphelenchus avenae]